MGDRHPQHDRIAEAIRSGYHRSNASMGYFVERTRFGWYCRNGSSPDRGRAIVERLELAQVDSFLADARGYFGNSLIAIWIENRQCAAAISPALEAAGCTGTGATIYLAYTGAAPSEPPISGVTIDAIADSNLAEFAAVKIKGFANSENEPSAEQLADEIAARRGELEGTGRQLIVRVNHTPAAVAAYYDGLDRLIFNLATRTPFRNQGLARHLLYRILADSHRRGCRSVVINTNPEDTPIRWYRRIGFNDEVYWTQSFEYRPEP